MSKNEIILPKHYKSTLNIKTGDWRTLRPEIRQKKSACQANCPAGNRIRDWIQMAKEGKFYEAWQLLTETNPLPAVLGRVCPHPCETACLRAQFDEAIAINALEKNLGDLALENNWRINTPSNQPLFDRHIAIIGAGPAGLSCAYQLRRLGYKVDIFEAENVSGGMLYLGIPEYRLPKDLLRREIENNVISLGRIEIHYGITADYLLWHHFLFDFDIVLVATGRAKSRKLNIEGEEKNHQVISGLDFLKNVNLGRETNIDGDIVIVVGGGNTAVDAARSAKMNGARSVSVLYRRREEDMPAFKEEIESAKKEGIEITTLVTPVRIERRCDGILRIECIRMDLGETDETGRPKPVSISGSQFVLFSHTLIIAIGEEPELSFLTESCRRELFPENVFIASDALENGGGLVVEAIGSGNKAAEEMDFYLKNGSRMELLPNREKPVQFSDLNPEYFEYRRSRLRRYPLTRDKEVIGRVMKEEAERCFSCGSCNSCGNCWLFCPDLAVLETRDEKFGINYDYCKGCGICAVECPRNAIDMEMEVKE